MGVKKGSMEGMEELSDFWKGKRVFITGHTGFKGSWLVLWLRLIGAEVYGYSLDPNTEPNLFTLAGIESDITQERGNILDITRLQKAIITFRPEIVFHLAAQPLVITSYEYPIETYATNVVGTANILEAIRHCSSVRSVVIVTSDKCYEHTKENRPFVETDRLGGNDPYSASKACAEITVSSMRNSFFPASRYKEHHVAIATARAGNVIGGGDFSAHRLIPDAMRAVQSGEILTIRNPSHVRPWQHVLDPLHGYLLLARKLYEEGPAFAEGWNFGPDDTSGQPVSSVIERLKLQLEGRLHTKSEVSGSLTPEAEVLRLDCTKAKTRLYWRPLLNLETALSLTASWYMAFFRGEDMRVLTREQIRQFKTL